MNQSTASFLGVPFTPTTGKASTMFVIQRPDTQEYIRVSEPGYFGWPNPLPKATRFPTADEAWAALALRNKTQGPGARRPFVIVPVRVTAIPGKEITEEVPARTAFILQFQKATGWLGAGYEGRYVEAAHANYSASYTDDIAKAKEFSAAEASQWIANRANTGWGQDFGNTFTLIPVTTPASTKVVGREPPTVTVELA